MNELYDFGLILSYKIALTSIDSHSASFILLKFVRNEGLFNE